MVFIQTAAAWWTRSILCRRVQPTGMVTLKVNGEVVTWDQPESNFMAETELLKGRMRGG